MSLSKDTVKYVSHLARIELAPQELEKLALQLQDILNFIDTLKKLDVEKIKPTSHILPINNVLREDSVCESLSTGKALQNAPQKEGNFFGAPKVIE